MYECDDCGMVWSDDQLLDIEDYFERVTPGGKVPDGQCRECGALCFEVPSAEEADQERVRRAGPELLAALEEAVKQLKWYRENDDRNGVVYMGEDEPQDAINAGVAAIARARGVSA